MTLSTKWYQMFPYLNQRTLDLYPENFLIYTYYVEDAMETFF